MLHNAQFSYSGGAVRALRDNRAVAQYGRPGAAVLAAYRVSRLDTPQLFALYLDDARTTLVGVLLALCHDAGSPQLRVTMEVDVTNALSFQGVEKDHLLHDLMPENTRIIFYAREEHLCLSFPGELIVYANLRLSQRVANVEALRFIIPGAAVCRLAIPSSAASPITSMEIHAYAYVCVGPVLYRSVTTLNRHLLAKTGAPLGFVYMAQLSTTVGANDSSLCDLTTAMEPPEIQHHILSVMGAVLAPTFFIGSLIHHPDGSGSYLDLNVFSTPTTSGMEWVRFTRSHLTDLTVFNLECHIGRVELTELQLYDLPAPESDSDGLTRGTKAAGQTTVTISNFALYSVRSLHSLFYFSLSFVACYNGEDFFLYQASFRADCLSRSITPLSKAIYLVIPRTSGFNDHSIAEQVVVHDKAATARLVTFIADRSANLLYVHDNSQVYYLLLLTSRIKITSSDGLSVLLYCCDNEDYDRFNVYGLHLDDASVQRDVELASDAPSAQLSLVSCRYLAKYTYSHTSSTLRMVSHGRNIFIVQDVSPSQPLQEALLSRPDINEEELRLRRPADTDKYRLPDTLGARLRRRGEMPDASLGSHGTGDADLRLTIFAYRDDHYTRHEYILRVTPEAGGSLSLRDVLFTSFHRYQVVYIMFCVEQVSPQSCRVSGEGIPTPSLIRTASTMSIHLPPSGRLADSTSETSSLSPERQQPFSRDFNVLFLAFTADAELLYGCGFEDLAPEANSAPRWYPRPAQFRCQLTRRDLGTYKLMYIMAMDCLRISFVDGRGLADGAVYVERFFLPFLSLTTSLLDADGALLQTYTHHVASTLLRRFVMNVLLQSHYIFSVSLLDERVGALAVRYTHFSLPEALRYLGHFTTLLSLDVANSFEYDRHLSSYLVMGLKQLVDGDDVSRLSYFLTGTLCLTGSLAYDTSSQGVESDLASWLIDYLHLPAIQLEPELFLEGAGAGVGRARVHVANLPERRADELGLFLILPSVYLQGLFVAVGDSEYRLTHSPEDRVTFYYLLSGRKRLLAALYQRDRNTRVHEYLVGHAFDDPQTRQVAAKNAFVLLARCRYYMAASWFLLAGDLENVFRVLTEPRYMGKTHLALTVFRFLRDVVLRSPSSLFPGLALDDDSLLRVSAIIYAHSIETYTLRIRPAAPAGAAAAAPAAAGTMQDEEYTDTSVLTTETASTVGDADAPGDGEMHSQQILMHCIDAYNAIYSQFVLSGYEKNDHLLFLIVTEVIGAVVRFTQRASALACQKINRRRSEALVSVLHVLSNLVFLCFRCRLVAPIKDIVNLFYRLYSCDIFSPIEKLRILNICLYTLQITQRYLPAAEAQYILAFSQRSLASMHVSTLLTFILYNHFIYLFAPEWYLGAEHVTRLARLRERAGSISARVCDSGLPSTTPKDVSELLRRIIPAVAFYLSLGHLTGDTSKYCDCVRPSTSTMMLSPLPPPPPPPSTACQDEEIGDELLQEVCELLTRYFRRLHEFLESSIPLSFVYDIIRTFEARLVPVIERASQALHEARNVATAGAGATATDAALKGVDEGFEIFDVPAMAKHGCNAPEEIAAVSRLDSSTSIAMGDADQLRLPHGKRPYLPIGDGFTQSDLEVHTLMISDYNTAGTSELEGDEDDRVPFGRYPILRQSLSFIVGASTTVLIERYEALLGLYSRSTLTPGGRTRFLPAAFNAALCASAHTRTESSCVAALMLDTFVTHNLNSLSHLSRYRIDPAAIQWTAPVAEAIESHPQTPIADLRLSYLFALLLTLQEFMLSNRSTSVFSKTMCSKYGIRIRADLLAIGSTQPQAFPAVFDEVHQSLLTEAELSYTEKLERATSTTVQERLAIVKKLMLLEVCYILNCYKKSVSQELPEQRRLRGQAEPAASVLVGFNHAPFVCALNGVLSRALYDPQLSVRPSWTADLQGPMLPDRAIVLVAAALKGTVYWQGNQKDWRSLGGNERRLIEARLITHRVFLGRFLLLHMHPETVLVFRLQENEAQKLVDLSLLLEYNHVTAVVQTRGDAFYVLIKGQTVLQVRFDPEKRTAEVSAPITLPKVGKRIIGGFGTTSDLVLVLGETAYFVLCKNGLVGQGIPHANLKFGVATNCVRLRRAAIHDAVLVTSFLALALISFVEETARTDVPKLVLAHLNHLSCSLVDGIELAERYVRLHLLRVREIHVLLLLKEEGYTILCKSLSGVGGAYMPVDSGVIPANVLSTLVWIDGYNRGDRLTFRLVYSGSKAGGLKSHRIEHQLTVM
ncbi:hypothetical protein GMRT_13394 [Giardia muris]|uniref:RAVE complex protein Rav1 C-terminal domain-containing protein n=1 Tax=Giardia muris TaxID=5742 RepID=A0A4Z1SL57_GIAMU|nr:hypothetical protein GMRT_13394 [Giardia muris]|eukprot:TNJ26362.1 hypothetical protein GMRT_13394 [Giardia muris]